VPHELDDKPVGSIASAAFLILALTTAVGGAMAYGLVRAVIWWLR